MPTLEELTLWIHIAGGTVALVAGVGALITKKGGFRHRGAGKVFLVSMGVVVGTVVILLPLDPPPLRAILTLVAIFSGYLVFSGYRALSQKRPAQTGHLVDWTAAGSVILACLGLGVWGISWVLDGRSFGIVILVFGGIGIAFGTIDIRLFQTSKSEEWMVNHLQRMIGAFIATVSAVSAVNLTPVIGITAWLWPTAVGVPLIHYWSKKA